MDNHFKMINEVNIRRNCIFKVNNCSYYVMINNNILPQNQQIHGKKEFKAEDKKEDEAKISLDVS